jgi:large subunit ribosomal protein L15
MDLKTVTKKGTKHAHVFRVGRGIGSGLGKTCGRGHKGWGARSGAFRRPGYEGGQMPIYRRVPKRGFTNARFRSEFTVINVSALEVFEGGAVVDLASVLAKGLASLNVRRLKVLGDGALTKALTVRAQKFSKSAAEKIRSAGGQAIMLDDKGNPVTEAAEEAKPPRRAKPAKQAKEAKEAKEAGPSGEANPSGEAKQE